METPPPKMSSPSLSGGSRSPGAGNTQVWYGGSVGSPINLDGQSPTGSPSQELTPLQKLLKGEEQQVSVPLKTVLIKVTKSLPAQKPPVFNCSRVGPGLYKASVEMNVAGTKHSTDPHVKIAIVDSEVCASPQLAQVSAVERSLKYLEKSRFIEVLDYSSTIVEELDDHSVIGDINSSLYVLEKVIHQWDVCMNRVGCLKAELRKREDAAKISPQCSKVAVVYYEARIFIESFFKRFNGKLEDAMSLYACFEAERSKFINNATDSVNRYREKGPLESVWFTERDVLESVVTTLGLGKVPDKMFVGEVKLWLPTVEHAHCGGYMRFRGDHRSSSNTAEEEAAGKALRFMEDNLKITVVDKNYEERVQVKAKHKELASLFARIVGLAEKLRIQWTEVFEALRFGIDAHGWDARDLENPGLTDGQVAALKYCCAAISGVHDEFTSEYEEAMKKLCGLGDMRARLADV